MIPTDKIAFANIDAYFLIEHHSLNLLEAFFGRFWISVSEIEIYQKKNKFSEKFK